ncbi:DNA repair protein [Pseudomonas fluorescens]|uniref:DUF488 domain-containing protein n=1 Tax=Pseudomonas rhodesiae TaxID=76760 RepID=UPI000CD3D967|nr:DUF488 domain-containing protein [Pseudomonas rhodesiae]POH43441.1 DNA repair protein [Pseudomonas fluorescens]
MNKVIYTVGHSTKPVDVFVQMLQSFNVDVVIDIRTLPRSRTNPQYNLDVLPDLLAKFEILHYRLDSLGGLRKKSKIVQDDVNAFWENRSFHNYADHALSDEFEEGLQQLLELSDVKHCVIMCAEAVWWRCHRRIVADYLLTRGAKVFHIMGIGKSTKAILTPSAELVGSKLTYPKKGE